MFKIIFLTSSNVKMSHVTFLMKEYDVELIPPPDYGKPYHEPRIYDRARLLEESLNDANQRLARNISILKQEEDVSQALRLGLEEDEQSHALTSDHQHRIFFIEDTSVRIDALSQSKEVPGVDIKYWMRENNFYDVDGLLKSKKNNRRVSVRSDIVLYLPPALRDSSGEIYKIFTGIVEGVIVEREEKFDVNSLYPWLDNKSFNKWFVPAGADTVFSLLPIEQSLYFDFRKVAVDKLLLFLEGKGLVRKRRAVAPPQTQGELFLSQDFIFCGPTCSGKTILAFLVSRKYGYQHIEASDFMRKAFLDRHGLDSGLSIHEFAKETLASDPGVVANQVADYILSTSPYRFIVTGFRSLNEVEVLSARLNRSDIKLIYIDSPIHVRYIRSLRRGRNDKAESFDEFQYQNSLQEDMGLSGLRNSSSVIRNEGGLISYLKGTIKGLITSDEYVDKLSYDVLNKRVFLPLEQVLMVALLVEEEYMRTPLTTSEIARVVTRDFLNLREKSVGQTVAVNKNNVSRFFNQKSNIHFRAVKTDKGIKYQLSQTGKSAALAILRSLNRA
ncbi:non-canonical purine NTP pyrophosphatase [Pseudomonas sp. S2_H01]